MTLPLRRPEDSCWSGCFLVELQETLQLSVVALGLPRLGGHFHCNKHKELPQGRRCKTPYHSDLTVPKTCWSFEVGLVILNGHNHQTEHTNPKL